MGELQTATVGSYQFLIESLDGMFPDVDCAVLNSVAQAGGVMVDGAVEGGGG